MAASRPRQWALTWQACISGDSNTGPGGSGACSVIPSATPNGSASSLATTFRIDVSSDGKSVYAAARNDSSLVHFSRNRGPGALAFADCLTGDEDLGPAPGSGVCRRGTGSIGRRVRLRAREPIRRRGQRRCAHRLRLGQGGNVVTLRRNLATGALTFVRCITGDDGTGPAPAGSGACIAGPALNSSSVNTGFDGLESVLVSPEGRRSTRVPAATPGFSPSAVLCPPAVASRARSRAPPGATSSRAPGGLT